MLVPGEKVTGETVAELGNRNRPLDMVVYEKDGENYLLMANNARGLMKISLDEISAVEAITERVPKITPAWSTTRSRMPRASCSSIGSTTTTWSCSSNEMAGKTSARWRCRKPVSATPPNLPASVSVSRTWALILAIILPSPAAAEVTIQFASSDRSQIAVVGLSAETLAEVADARLDRAAWQRVLALYVSSGDNRPTLPVLGDYTVQDSRLIFTPQFPLKPGLAYRAVFDANALPTANNRPREPLVETTLEVPGPLRGQKTVVEAIFPSGDVLPENLLKFYIHFSAPMSRGDSYRHIRLLDAAGAPVDFPFLELAEELWDESGKRLTLLLDPGRVKQGLKPHEEVGRALAQGNAYTLLIADTWPDAQRAPLARAHRKKFHVAQADTRQPDPKQWRLQLPAVGSLQPLIVEFNEPLDHALLQHTIRVSNPSKKMLDGRVAVSEQETEWHFQPEKPWDQGAHQLLVDTILEDRAGNSIGRPFEVDLSSGRSTDIAECTVPFTIGTSATDAEVKLPYPNDR